MQNKTVKITIAFIAAIVVVGILVSFFGNNYKLEMGLTESNIKHFIKGIASHGKNLDIELKEIEIYSDKEACARLYVRHSSDEAADISINFNHGHNTWHGWNDDLCDVGVSCASEYSPNSGPGTVAAIAEAIELMLTNETKVPQDYAQYFDGSDVVYGYKRYEIGSYHCLCIYEVNRVNKSISYTIANYRI